MELDEIFENIGSFGRYQKVIILPMLLLVFSAQMASFASIFTEAFPNYRCAAPTLLNDTYFIRDINQEIIVNKSVPWETIDGVFMLSHTKVFKYLQNVTHPPNNATKIDCDRWVFDHSVFKDTAITQFTLVRNGSDVIVTLMQSMFMAGMLVGSILFGKISDAFGRKKGTCFAACLLIFSGVLAAWIGNEIGYIICRFFSGVAAIGVFTCFFVYSIEIIGHSTRAKVGFITSWSTTLSGISYVGYAYLLKGYGWKWIQTVISAQIAIVLPIFLYIPESPRWLLANKKYSEGVNVLKKFAEYNGSNYEIPSVEIFKDSLENSHHTSIPIKHLLKSKILIFRIFIMNYMWFVAAMAYFGLTLNSGNYGGDIFVNSLMITAIEIPASLFVYPTLDIIGRKKHLVGSMFLTAVSLLTATVLQIFIKDSNDWSLRILAMIGKFGNSISFTVVYYYSAELFPTVFRNTCVGTNSLFGRVGSILAPVFITLGQQIGGRFKESTPLFVFGCVSFIGSFLGLLLPETRYLNLPGTIKEAENIGRVTTYSERDGDEDDPLLHTITKSVHTSYAT